MARYVVDWLDIVLDLLRADMPGVTVMSRIPDHITDYLPLVVVRRTGGEPPARVDPRFYDVVLVNVQCFCADTPGGVDQYRAASDLADQVRGVLWRAVRTQRVIPDKGWLSDMRESTGPIEITDPDAVALGRFTASYELRVRPATISA